MKAKLNVEPLEDRVVCDTSYSVPFSTAVPLAFSFFTGYTPAQIARAYGFDQLALDGSGQTIAIVDAYDQPNIQADVATFDAAFGLPACNLTVINQNGGAARPAPNVDWGMEESLDVEWAHAMAPGARIVLVEANSNQNTDLFAAEVTAAAYPGVSVVSNSWGTVGEPPPDEEAVWDAVMVTPPGHSPVSFVASAGDNTGLLTGYPAFSPRVLSVGGTSLYLNNDGSWGAEGAWVDGGGMVSSYEPTPAWQAGLGYPKRAVPDVAYVADLSTGVDVFDSQDGGWLIVGGTSVGSPQWASLIAVADQARNAAGVPSLDNGALATILYANPQAFHDITTGSNSLYPAGPGYDLATGLGSPNVPLIADALAGYTVPRRESVQQEIVGLLREDLAFLWYAALAQQNPFYVPRAEQALGAILGDPFARTPAGMAVQAWVAQQIGEAA